MNGRVSIAIETSCRAGGVALGRGDELIEVVHFDVCTRHATVLVRRLDGLLARAGLRPLDVDEAYVSAGPGSFTGLRVGVTVARTLAQAVPALRCVAVPTTLAVAHNADQLRWQNLAVITDAREGCIHASLFTRREGATTPAGEPIVTSPQEFLASAPRPLLLVGEGLRYHEFFSQVAGEGQEGLEIADEHLDLPTAEGVWRIGRQLAAAGQFTDYRRLLPIYTRSPKALR